MGGKRCGAAAATSSIVLLSSAPNCLFQCRFRSSFASLAPIFTDKFSFALHTYLFWFFSLAIPRTTHCPQSHYTLVSLHSGLASLDIIGPVITRSKQFKMRAARYYGKEDVRIEHDVPAPPEQLMEGQVRVQPAFVGICGTGMPCSSSSNTTTKRY